VLKKKPAPAPLSFEDRLCAAHAQADAAVSVVETIATDLEQAAAEKRAVVIDIDTETDRLYALLDHLSVLRSEALEYEAKNLAKADKIRALVSA
jgi:hypothetical protein